MSMEQKTICVGFAVAAAAHFPFVAVHHSICRGSVSCFIFCSVDQPIYEYEIKKKTEKQLIKNAASQFIKRLMTINVLYI